jgi:hypothetical protein
MRQSSDCSADANPQIGVPGGAVLVEEGERGHLPALTGFQPVSRKW